MDYEQEVTRGHFDTSHNPFADATSFTPSYQTYSNWEPSPTIGAHYLNDNEIENQEQWTDLMEEVFGSQMDFLSTPIPQLEFGPSRDFEPDSSTSSFPSESTGTSNCPPQPSSQEYSEDSLFRSSEVTSRDQSSSPASQICFGMISHVPIFVVKSSLLMFESGSLPLTFKAPESLYRSDTSALFGSLNDRPAKILTNLCSEQDIEIQIIARTVNRRAPQAKKGGRKPGPSEPQYVLDAIVYGPEDLCDPVGSYLTKCGICLQDPLGSAYDVPYRNPHILSRSQDFEIASSLNHTCVTPEAEQIVSPDDLFSCLSNDQHIAQTEAPDSIQTTLYPHQKKALTFMVKREEGWQYDGSMNDIWAKEFDETGQLTYTNVITEKGQKSVPPDAKGGLLADQMGLGKTLSIISLIAMNTCPMIDPVKFTTTGTLRCLKATLVVVPYPLLETWNKQLERHLRPNTLSWTTFHGPQKKKTLALRGFDIVITTYETLVRQQKRHQDSQNYGETLFSFHWHRIVLDEAHMIRNRSTAMARATCAVSATNRWAMTGTPIQNRATDFASLVEFLKIYPFSDPKLFDTEIIKPWLKSPDQDVSRINKLVVALSICRTKNTITLPPRHDKVVPLKFSTEEQELYGETKMGTVQKLDLAMSSNPIQPGQFLNALTWLNELRLLCNHGLAHAKRDSNKKLSIIVQDIQTWNKAAANKAFETLLGADEAKCSICENMLTSGDEAGSAKPFLSQCLTLTCASCIKDSPRSRAVPTCQDEPLCKAYEVSWPTGSVATTHGRSVPNIPPEHVSTKLKRLLKDLHDSPSDEKSVVFSYWTFTLDLIESLLKQTSITYTRIDGKDSGQKRNDAIELFQTDPNVQVILVSITCGGSGLDLTAASVAYLMEPQWNPMMEEQALSRVHRLGQTKEVRTIRYRIVGSYEERVVETQKMKRQIAADAFAVDRRRNQDDNMNKLQEIRAQLV